MSTLVVYDTMLFFQAATQPSRLHTTMRAIREGRVVLCLSAELIAEIVDVLTRPKYQARFPALHREAVEGFIADVLARGKMFDSVPQVFNWSQHPDDDHLFNLAIYAKAKYLVTWETRILKLASNTTPAGDSLRKLAPELAIITPITLAEAIKNT